MGSLLHAQTFEEKIDSLHQLLEAETIPTKKVDLLNEISYAYRRLYPEKIYEYALKAEKLAEEIEYIKGVAIANKNIGIAHFKKGSGRDTIIYYYQKATEYAAQVEDYYTMAACQNNIALIYNFDAEHNIAIQYFLKGIELFDTHFEKETRLKALMLCNVGFAYFKMDDYDHAFQYMQRGMAVAKKNGDKSIPSIYLGDLGRIQVELGKYEQATQSFDKAFVIQNEIGDYESSIQTLLYLIDLKVLQDKLQEAINLANKALQIAQERKYINLEIDCLNQLGRLNNKLGQNQRALDFTNTALEKSKEINSLMHEKESLDNFFDAYCALGRYREAVEIAKDIEPIENKLKVTEQNEITARLEKAYETKEKQNRIDALNREKQIQESRIRLFRVFSILAITALGIILFLMYKRNQSATIISEKNAQLEKYIEYNLQLENFAYIASHDLKTPLRTIISFTQLLQKRTNHKLSSEELEYLDFIISGTKEMSFLIDDLLNYSRIERSTINLERVEVKLMLQKVLTQIKALIEENGALIQFKLETLSVVADKIKLQQVFQNIIVNAIKFSKPGAPPEVTISCKNMERNWLFEVADKGIGIDSSYFEKIFLVFKRLNRKEDYEGSGMGLAICKKIIEKHGGEIWVDSKEGEGSTFFFTIPKA